MLLRALGWLSGKQHLSKKRQPVKHVRCTRSTESGRSLVGALLFLPSQVESAKANTNFDLALSTLFTHSHRILGPRVLLNRSIGFPSFLFGFLPLSFPLSRVNLY